MIAAGLVIANGMSAGAQSSGSTGAVSIIVTDVATGEPLRDARVLLSGSMQAMALTDRIGIVRYVDVPSGLYHVRVQKSGFDMSMSPRFEVLGNRGVELRVTLGPSRPASSNGSTGPKVIGQVRAKVAISTTTLNENSAVRRISDSLTDALGALTGVSVTQSSGDPNASQTISLREHDEGQTAVLLDGVPLGAPGAATNLRAINTDLFARGTPNFSPQAGALAGSVNFGTLQPTQSLQSRFATAYGTYDRFNYQMAETGSFGKLGFAVLHAYRAGNNPLTFNTYADQSGLTYAHDGEATNVGSYVKLRYAMDEKTTVNVTGLQSNQGTSLLCTQDVTVVPCGYGPGNTSSGAFQFMYGSVQTLVGDVAATATAYVSGSTVHLDQAARLVAGRSDPFAETTRSNSRGIAFALAATRGRHTLALNGSTFAGVTDFVPMTTGSFVTASHVATTTQFYQLTDSFKATDTLSLGANASVATGGAAGGSFIGGVSLQFRPVPSDAFAASVSVGSAQPASGLVRSFSDPASARFNCSAGTANVSGPGDVPGSRQTAASGDISWAHQWNNGGFTAGAYRQVQTGQLIDAQIGAPSLGLGSGDPYIAALQTLYSSPQICGAGAVLSPSGVYVSEPIGGTSRVYQGVSLSGRLGLGPNVTIFPSYSVTSAVVVAADPRLNAVNSTTILGRQIPGRALHRGALTIDVNSPRTGLEFLGNASYVGSNNGQHLVPYILVNAGIARQFGPGRLTVFASNLFNTESGAFSSLAFAQPLPTSGGALLRVAGIPNQPRSFTISYAVTAGARHSDGLASGAASSVSASFPPPAGVDPLSTATSRSTCSAQDAKIAAPYLAQFRAAIDAYQTGAPLPQIDFIRVIPHGERGGNWYFEFRPQLPSNSGAGGTGIEEGGASTGAPPTGQITVGPGQAPVLPPVTSARAAALQHVNALLNCSYNVSLSYEEGQRRGYTEVVRTIGYAPGLGFFDVKPKDVAPGGGSLKPPSQ